MKTSLTSKPGQFRATCRRSSWVLEQHVPQGWDLDTITSKWDKKQEAAVFLVPCTLDTTDRAEFEEHMRHKHDGGIYRWDGGGLEPNPAETRNYNPRMAMPVRKAKLPRATSEGKPFKTLKFIQRDLRTCTDCGLVAEIDGSNATELWWTEHQRGCSMAQAAS